MSMSSLFDSWSGLLRVVVIGVLAYAALVLILRISGNRTLSKMSAFDLVVTVALGSTLATIILSKDVALAEGVLAVALLVALQFAVTWTSIRFPPASSLIKAAPSLLYFRGDYLRDQMRRQRVMEAEILAAVRQQGVGSLDDVEAVVLESDGSLAVVTGFPAHRSTLAGVAGLPASASAHARIR